ncbi:MAG: insulinase family protein [Hyphomicrobiaceae bacterium]
MSTTRSDRAISWYNAQPPGRRLWLMVLGIVAALGVLSMLLPAPAPVAKSAKTADEQAKAVQTNASNVSKPASPATAAVALTSDASALSEVKPGQDGKAVKTISVPVASVNPPATAEATPNVNTAAHAAVAAAPVAKSGAADVASGVRPSKAWRDPANSEQKSGSTAVLAAAPSASAQAPAGAPSNNAERPMKAVASKMKIQEIKSPGGITAWLVEEHSVPLLALRFAFEGGNSQDPAGKEGIANFITAMMDEGAGDLDAAKFQERAEELALRMAFQDSRDELYGSFDTLSVNRDPALDMLRMALTKPRFDKDAVERIKKQLLANLAYSAKNPQRVAGNSWSRAAFPEHVYGRPTDGTTESIASITSEDLEAYRRNVFARDTLKVVAVGDIDAKTLGEVLDRVFGELPAKATLAAVDQTGPKPKKKLTIVDMDVPQSVVQFGLPGLARKDPDFMAAYVMNHILGGGGFASRLTEQVREKRGLAYSVYSYLQPYRKAALFAGGVATKNESVKESIDVIRAELKRMADEGPTQKELDAAKSYLTGSFALRFDTNSKIASQLLGLMVEDMGIDYVDKRNALVDAVTMDDVKRAAKRILKVDDLFITVVGKPKGLSSTN